MQVASRELINTLNTELACLCHQSEQFSLLNLDYIYKIYFLDILGNFRHFSSLAVPITSDLCISLKVQNQVKNRSRSTY